MRTRSSAPTSLMFFFPIFMVASRVEIDLAPSTRVSFPLKEEELRALPRRSSAQDSRPDVVSVARRQTIICTRSSLVGISGPGSTLVSAIGP